MLSSALSLHYLPSCAPARPDRVALESLGPFPASASSFASFSVPQDAPVRLPDLPLEARLFRLTVETSDFRGVAIAPSADDGRRFEALVLPLGQHCPLEGALPRALEGAALALVEGRDLVLAGGIQDDGETATRDVTILQVARAAWRADGDGLFVPRAHAAAASAQGEVWVIGGAQSLGQGAPGLDSFERYDGAAGRFTGLGRLAVPRLQASALALLDGAVLVAGGQARAQGEALRSLERIAAGADQGELLESRLPGPAIRPRLSQRDDGAVALAADGDAPWLALLGPAQDALVDVSLPALPAGRRLSLSSMCALPGARLAWLEMREERTTGRLWLLLSGGDWVVLDDWLGSFAELAQPQMLALRDGRLLLTGVRAGEAVARVVDPSSRDVRVRTLAAAVKELLLRADGSVLELAADAVLAVREDARTPFDNPGGTLLARDEHVLALDTRDHFQRDGLSLTATTAGARLDLAGLRYDDVEIRLEVEGPVELLLRRRDGAERSVHVSDARVGPALCEAARGEGEAISVVRREEEIVLTTGGTRLRCHLDGLRGPVALGLRFAEPGARVHVLVVTRR